MSQATHDSLERAPDSIPFPGAKAGGNPSCTQTAGSGNRPSAAPRLAKAPTGPVTQHRPASRPGSPRPSASRAAGSENRPQIKTQPGPRPTGPAPRRPRRSGLWPLPPPNGVPYRASPAERPPRGGRGAAGPPSPCGWRRMLLLLRRAPRPPAPPSIPRLRPARPRPLAGAFCKARRARHVAG